MEIEIRRSRRRTMSLEITPDARLLVRAPLRMPDREIKRFVNEKTDWIEKNLQRLMERRTEEQTVEKLTDSELKKLAEQALRVLPEKTAYYAAKMGVTYGRITIRNQKSRWGSCSSKGNLNFNCLLMLTPEKVQDYVVVHELCHRKEMNHSAQFWNEVGQVLPDYRDRRRWLKDNGGSIIGRMQS